MSESICCKKPAYKYHHQIQSHQTVCQTQGKLVPHIPRMPRPTTLQQGALNVETTFSKHKRPTSKIDAEGGRDRSTQTGQE